MGIRENLEKVKEDIRSAAIRCGRDPEDITLLCVTKLHGIAEIEEAIGAGARLAGENKVQELLDKYEKVKPDEWHLIGHLQTNKVKYIIDKVSMIHSVDSVRLVNEIEKRAEKAGIIMDILIETDPYAQETKYGLDPEELPKIAEHIARECPHVRLRGLMGIAPFSEDPEDARPFFREIKSLFDWLKNNYAGENIVPDTLSLGMTNDFKVAIEEGSTLVRVGTAIFGKRDYRKEEK